MRALRLAARELLGGSRRRLTFILRILCLAVMAAWVYSEGGGAGQRVRSYYSPGKELFEVMMGGMWFFLGSLALFLPFGALSKEKERKTGDLLFAAGLKPREIVLGKLLGSLGLCVVLLATSVPAAMIALGLGGVSGTDVAVAFSGALALIVLVGSFGALAGAAESLLLAFALAAAYFLAPLLCFMSRAGEKALKLLWLPAYLVIALGRSATKWEYILPLLTTAFLSVLSLWAASYLMRPRLAVTPRAKMVLRRMRLSLIRLNRRLFRGAMIGRGLSRACRERAPLLWREFRRSLSTRFFFQLVFGALLMGAWAVALSLVLRNAGRAGYGFWRVRDFYNLTQGGLVLVLWVVPGALLARALVKERRSGALALILAAPTSERRVLGAHVASAVWCVWGFGAVLFLHELTGWFMGEALVGAAGWAGGALAVTGLVFSLGCGAVCGVFFRTSARALGGYVFALAVWLFAAALAAEFARPYGGGLQRLLLFASPLRAMEPVIDDGNWGDIEDWAGQMLGCVLGALGLVFAARGMRARAS